MPPPGPAPAPHAGLEAVFLANRDKLVRFLLARGAGDAAEDLAHDVWLKVAGRADGPIGNPLAYLYRAADTLMIDRYRARRQAEARDQAWSDSHAQEQPAADRSVAARQEAGEVAALLTTLGSRREAVFRRVRIDGAAQREVAAELGVSLSTVESDLRIACRALADLKERLR